MSKLVIPDGYGNFVVRFHRNTNVVKHQSIAVGFKIGTASPALSDLLDGFVGAWTDTGSLNGSQPGAVIADNLNVTVNVGGSMYGSDRPLPWTAGGGSPQLCSSAVSYTVKKHTVFIGKKFRGRLQLPWAVESEVDSQGQITDSVVTAYDTALEVFRLAIDSDATLMSGPYLLHHAASPAPTLIQTLTLRNTVGTVRKRQVVGS
jgi:hypothetical protein